MKYKDRFMDQAEGDEERAYRLRSAFYKEAASGRQRHDACTHENTKRARDRCRKARAVT